LEDQVNHI